MQIVLPRIGTVAAWRLRARELAQAGIPPEAILWQVGAARDDLFAGMPAPVTPAPATTKGAAKGAALRLPRAAVETLESALHHCDPERFARAYAILWRLARGDLRWGDRSDPMLRRLLAQDKAVRRDIHKMHAFVRFREVTPPGANRRAFAAWFEPDHPILEPAAPFFARRFGDMDWLIATPQLTARCEFGALSIEETAAAAPPPPDAAEDLWRVYFAAIFNPARLMVKAMTSQMPRKYWKNLPEAELIPGMIRDAEARVRTMHSAPPTVPPARAARLRHRGARGQGPRRGPAAPDAPDGPGPLSD